MLLWFTLSNKQSICWKGSLQTEKFDEDCSDRDVHMLSKGSLQEILLPGLCVRDLVNNQSYSALREDVRHAISHLNEYNSLGCRKTEHWQQVHNWSCAKLITVMNCAVPIFDAITGLESVP